ncbi:MAG: hypothetical protein ACYCY9_07825 [Thiobacillus sp.]
MNKLMSSLVAATIVGAFSMSAIAAEAPKAAPAAVASAEKPAAAAAKKHVAKLDAKKMHAAPVAVPAMPAEPARK